MKNKIQNLFDLKNQIILVTGGAGLLGSEFSSALSNMDAVPIILDRNQKSIEILKRKFTTLRFLSNFKIRFCI